MEFRIDRETFLRSLQKIQGIVEKRTSMPILSNVLIEAVDDKSISITATDLDVGMKSTYHALVETPGKITVSAKKLYEIVKELPNQEISFATRENDWVEIRCGKVQFNIVGLSPDEFPYFPAIKEENLFEIESSMLRGLIERTSYAICNDDTKYNLNGIFTKVEEDNGIQTLRMVATDGHRLSMASGKMSGKAGPELIAGVILPKKGIFELKKVAEEDETKLSFGFMDNSAVLKKGDSYLVMRLVDGDFPDYNRVIPVANNLIVAVNRDDFTHSVRRMAILSSEKFKGIMLEISAKSIKISSSNPELGDATEEIDVSYEGESFSVRFNARYLLDVLGVADTETVEMKFKDELSPSIIVPDKDDSFLAVIMPMRL